MRSAMGHERRFGGKPPLPIYPKQQTLRAAVGRSLKGQSRTFAPPLAVLWQTDMYEPD